MERIACFTVPDAKRSQGYIQTTMSKTRNVIIRGFDCLGRGSLASKARLAAMT